MTTPQLPIDVPFRVFLKVLVAAFVVFCFLKTAPLLLLLVLACLIATTLYPVEQWLVRMKVPRTLAFLLIALLLVGALVAFLGLLLPKIVEQFGALPEQFTRVTKELSENIHNEALRAKLEAALKDPPKLIGNLPEKVVTISSGLMNGLFNIGLLLVMSLYLLADGKKTYQWLRAFFSAGNQKRIDETSEEVSKIIVAYVAGQLITSGLVAVFVFVLLTLTHVPAALSLATLAALFDILPLIGFLVSLGAAVLIALTVSGSTALIVVAAFIGYHFLENYLIVPWIYGNRMRLSGLIVLLSLIFAVEIGGVLAGVLILPIIAAYPIIEKIWLGRFLGTPTIAQHASLEAKADAKPHVD